LVLEWLLPLVFGRPKLCVRLRNDAGGVDEDGVAFRHGSAGTLGERFVRRREAGERLHDGLLLLCVRGKKCGKLKTSFEDKKTYSYALTTTSRYRINARRRNARTSLEFR
jgi:hypothetical protein